MFLPLFSLRMLGFVGWSASPFDFAILSRARRWICAVLAPVERRTVPSAYKSSGCGQVVGACAVISGPKSLWISVIAIESTIMKR